MKKIKPGQHDHGNQTAANDQSFPPKNGLHGSCQFFQLKLYRIQLDFSAAMDTPAALA